MSVTNNTKSAKVRPEAKYNISANSIDELMLGVMEIVLAVDPAHIVIKDSKNAKKGETSQYGLYEWEQDPTPARFDLGGEMPVALSVNLVYRKLTPADQIGAVIAKRAAATTKSIETLTQRLERLRARQAQLK